MTPDLEQLDLFAKHILEPFRKAMPRRPITRSLEDAGG